MENKDEKLLSEAKNHKIVATILGVQGAILVITGIFIGQILGMFGYQPTGTTSVVFMVLFIISGIVDFGIAFHFYRKSRVFID